MGHKVHPKGLRLGIVFDWDAKWFSDKKGFKQLLLEDIKVREFVMDRLGNASVARLEIERAANRLRLTVHTAKPGMVIGRGGAGVEALRKELVALTKRQVAINIVEIKTPELDAQLVAENIAQGLERRISARRAMKNAITRAMRMGARGIRIVVGGRLSGAEMARRERSWQGSVPLHTLRADIDYGAAEAHTTYGRIGVKVWIYKGEILSPRMRVREA
ncbi:MAG: 30S ribosomal protein S3 [Firmicutes bacterium RBG_13_65_8]|nr:MAG: 30S ribosomal protein S3 [Firmicutes bacterium RBG_13_65_8]